jgi:NAD(P)H-hydrate epimerase
VIDADALNLLAARNQPLPAGLASSRRIRARPARLLGSTVQDIQNDRFGAAHSLAEKFKAVVVLKGAGTIVAAPDHRPAVIGAGNPGMAVGGMGDLLTGVIAALRAQGQPAFDAACVGALPACRRGR